LSAGDRTDQGGDAAAAAAAAAAACLGCLGAAAAEAIPAAGPAAAAVDDLGVVEAVPRWQEAYDSSRGLYYYYCEEMQVRGSTKLQYI
jgi:hypothetical protein